MSPRKTDTRERMLASTAALVRERGASATSVDDILTHSHAPRGSVYHHFPGGRAQLIEEALDLAGATVGEIVVRAGDRTPSQVFDAFIASWRSTLVDSQYRAGCPVLAVAVESNDNAPQLTHAAARAFASWQTALAELLHHHGATPVRARRIATLVVASVEGAVVLCRVERSPRPIDDIARELRPLISQAAKPETDSPV
ncbi:Uncharacterized HTH-type transcriptional regulator Rv0196 [Frankia sp. AiPs1]|uniref:TetR/AcrR family transcriptional regulator n=1 Tax=Frankia sp. AiPa1 TaxID=573492 RepID=UPI00202B000C|nr:TetR/AcrR family transcriptional regulator [Frankia sp. AiPa1]MCL9761015.1 TetR/AcrR family transcriptional regulator [Frankia sp. AiPa1]